MSYQPLLLGTCLLGGILLSVGCDTVARRIEEKAEIFSQLGPETQDNLQRGLVKEGYTKEMVYIALGRPNQVASTPDGNSVIWTYLNFNTPDGGFMLQPKHITRNRALDSSRLLFSGDGWHEVTGREDLDDGVVTMPEPKVRRKTAQEMIEEETQQELEIAFKDGRVVDFRLVRI